MGLETERWVWICTCGFTHISECPECDIEETLRNRAICPACRSQLFKPRKLEVTVNPVGGIR